MSSTLLHVGTALKEEGFVQRIFCGALVLAVACSLAACGGAGGGGVAPSPVPSATSIPGSAEAVGTLADDPSGLPLSGVPVRLDPWVAYATPGPTPTPLLVTSTDASGHFTIAAPSGHYLLVIGSDDPADTNRPTIHDNLELSGQRVLVAPTMPPIPGITPAPVELNGDYRLATIDRAHELPCITDYDAQRVQLGLAKPVIDEWLTENVRGRSQPVGNAIQWPSWMHHNLFGFLSTGNSTQTGGTDCSTMAAYAFTRNSLPYATASQWFAGSYLPYQSGSTVRPAYGASEFPIDPRLFTDPNVPNWP